MKHNTFKSLSAENLNFCIVRARFNKEVTDGLLEGALKALENAGAKREHVLVYEVPGSYDIPYGVQIAADGKHVDAIVTLGAIIKGETQHDEHIATAVFGELLRLEQTYKLPISLGIITTHTLEQAQARSGEDENNVGAQAAQAAIELLHIKK